MEERCPSASPSYNARDIFDVQCPKCDTEIEFLGDDHQNKCPKCGEVVANPHLSDSLGL